MVTNVWKVSLYIRLITLELPAKDIYQFVNNYTVI